MKIVSTVAKVLVIIGAINWGLWGAFQFDLVAYLFGGDVSALSRIIYSLVGLAGLWELKCVISCCKSGSNHKKGGGCC